MKQNEINSKIRLPDGSPIYDSDNVPPSFNSFQKYILIPAIQLLLVFIAIFTATTILHLFGYCLTSLSGNCNDVTNNPFINAIIVTVIPAIFIVIRSISK